jgi:hypothetical protein
MITTNNNEIMQAHDENGYCVLYVGNYQRRQQMTIMHECNIRNNQMNRGG